MKKLVAIIMGSDSDLEVMSKACSTLEDFDVGYEISIISAHRTPQRISSFVTSCEKKGIRVIIAGAGGAAHLPGMTAANTHLPVIGVPIKTQTADGLDSLLSISQMPPGVPVATVAINGAQNSALLALQILSTADSKIAKKIIDYKKNMKNSVLKKAEKLEKNGATVYLKSIKKYTK